MTTQGDTEMSQKGGERLITILAKKFGALLAVVMVYAFVAGVTYRVHEGFYPGSGMDCPTHEDPYRLCDGSKLVSFFWPLAIPVVLLEVVVTHAWELGARFADDT